MPTSNAPSCESGVNRPVEPIALSAPLARRLAPRLCRRDPASGEDCSWYHGLWQDLRALGLAASPVYQADFFLGAFKRMAKRRRLRLLISGAADYSILAHVLWGCRESGLEVDITVTDRCNTPLFLNQWYAEQAGHPITTVQEHILAYQPEEPFDVICSHAFLGQFSPQRRTELVGKWSQWLAPMGTVLTVNRVRPGGTRREIRFSPEEARAFCLAVEQRIRESQSWPEAEAAEALARARIYAQRLRIHPISPAEFTQLFLSTGFRIDALSTVASGESRNRNVSGPAIPRESKHACLVATKARSGE